MIEIKELDGYKILIDTKSKIKDDEIHFTLDYNDIHSHAYRNIEDGCCGIIAMEKPLLDRYNLNNSIKELIVETTNISALYTDEDMAKAIEFGTHLEAGIISEKTKEDFKVKYPNLNQYLRLNPKGVNIIGKSKKTITIKVI